MLYGHIEKAKHRIDHLVRLRELQDETGGFQTFIPLAFHPDNSRMDEIPKPSGVMDLKTMAISRLMLDNFPHIKAYWVMLGIKTAQVALSFGADDLDGTVVHETIYHEAGAETPQEIGVAEIRAPDPPRRAGSRSSATRCIIAWSGDGARGRRASTSTCRRWRWRGSESPGGRCVMAVDGKDGVDAAAAADRPASRDRHWVPPAATVTRPRPHGPARLGRRDCGKLPRDCRRCHS